MATRRSVQAQFDFTRGGAYVATQARVAIPSDVQELRIGAKSTQGVRISVRLVDSTGQCHQFVKSCAGTGSWETLRVALDAKASEHWGGANDGKMHFPVKELSLCVGKPEKGGVGTATFGNVVTVGK